MMEAKIGKSILRPNWSIGSVFIYKWVDLLGKQIIKRTSKQDEYQSVKQVIVLVIKASISQQSKYHVSYMSKKKEKMVVTLKCIIIVEPKCSALQVGRPDWGMVPLSQCPNP